MATQWTTTATNNYNNAIGNSTYTNIGSSIAGGSITGNGTITIASHGSILQNTLNSGSTSGSSKISIQKISYNVLGEDVEVVNGWYDTNLVIIISTLNVLKKPFYDELLKNGYIFPKEIEEFLKIKFRDILIDEIFN